MLLILRLFVFVVVVGLIAAGAVWLADRPGLVMLEWQGWRVDTSVPVAALVVLALAFVISALIKVVRVILSLPRRFAESRRQVRQRKGYAALTDGLAAVAAGDPKLARRHAKRAGNLLPEAQLTALLSAQAAQLAGAGAEARAHYERLLDRPETAFLGYRGLLTQALRDGDRATALEYARRGFALNPSAGWLAETLYALLAETGQWVEALDVMARAARTQALPRAETERRRALALNERAAQLAEDGDTREAIDAARAAHKADPGLVPATVRYADLLADAGKRRKATSIIEDSWVIAPHPDLARAYADLVPDEEPLARVKRLGRLVKLLPDQPAGLIVLGEAELDAQLWGQARTHLTRAAELEPGPHVYRLLARLEEAEHANRDAAREWLAKAAESPADEAWTCAACGSQHVEWAAVCPTCSGVDTLYWGDKPAPNPNLPVATLGM